MRFSVFVAGLALTSAFPSYIPCASDEDTLLKVGTHTCSRAKGKKGAEISRAKFGQASFFAKTRSGERRDHVAPGETLSLTLDMHLLNPLLDQSVWMVARVSDSGANGTLLGDRDTFEAQCGGQLASMRPITARKTELEYRAPCEASEDIVVTVVHSRCLFGCSTGAVASGMITPGDMILNELRLMVQGAKDPSCGRPTPDPMPGHRDICRTTACWDGSCEEDVSGDDGPRQVPLKRLPITVDRWDAERKTYETLGQVEAVTMQDNRWQSLLHGPTRLGGNRSTKAIPGKMPPVYVSVDASNSVFRVDGINFDGAPATSTRVAWAAAPSSQHHVMNEKNELKSMIVSSGQPFGDTKGANESDHMITQGGLYSISPEGCHKLWPNELDEPERMSSGGIVNRVVCHDASGICFFSNWNHEFDKDSKIPHCLHWCALDDPTSPTSCTASEPLRGGPDSAFLAGRFCAEPVLAKHGSEEWVAPHGMLIGEAKEVNGTWHFEMIVSFSDGLMGMDEGVSFARKLQVVAQRRGLRGAHTDVYATGYAAFGTELTTDTLQTSKFDVRLDHMWRDAAGYVWFSTFGSHNIGEHVLDYETGKLLVSFHGFERYPHLIQPYNPSGISIVGGFGEEGSVAIVAIETVPPLPFIHGALAFVDISNGWGLTDGRQREEFV